MGISKNRHNNDNEKSIYYLSSLFVCFQYSDGFVQRIYTIHIHMYLHWQETIIYTYMYTIKSESTQTYFPK